MKARKIIKTMKTMKWVPGRETTIVFVLPYGTGVFVHSSGRLKSNEIATSNSICLCSCMSLFSLSWRALHSWGQREQRKSILAKTSKQHIIKNRLTKQNKLTGRITRKKKKTSYKIKKIVRTWIFPSYVFGCVVVSFFLVFWLLWFCFVFFSVYFFCKTLHPLCCWTPNTTSFSVASKCWIS